MAWSCPAAARVLYCLVLGLGLGLALASAQADTKSALSSASAEGRPGQIPPRQLLWKQDVTLPDVEDSGQHFGTLFEMQADGATVVAAGFVSGGQSGGQNDHRSVNFFVDLDAAPGRVPASVHLSGQMLKLPARPYAAGSLFRLTTFQGDLIAYPRGSLGLLRSYLPKGQWQDLHTVISRRASQVPIVSIQVVRDQMLATFGRELYFGDVQIDLSNIENLADIYFENALYFRGRLLFSAVDSDAFDNRRARIIDCEWRPGRRFVQSCRAAFFAPIDDQRGRFRAAQGMHGLADGRVLVYGLSGFLYLYTSGSLRPLFDIDASRDWQLYSSLERYDSVHMGHFPSGNLLSLSMAGNLAGDQNTAVWDAEQRDDALMSPPVVARDGVLRDEAQSLMFMRSDLVTGLWPWAEMYKGVPGSVWEPMVASLTGGVPSPDGLHPHQLAVGNNCLGMRLFQIVPWRGGLVFQTTMKNMDPECIGALGKVSAESAEPYGQVYYRDVPGQLTCALQWTSAPRKLSFQVSSDDEMAVYQDGNKMCSRQIDAVKAKLLLTRSGAQLWLRPAVGLYGRRTQASAPHLR